MLEEFAPACLISQLQPVQPVSPRSFAPRRLMGLKPAANFSEITPDPEIAQILQDLYGTVDNIDAYVGGLAEPHYLKGHVGELFYKSMQDQFFRLREGDWWYYENTDNGLFNDTEIEEIRSTGELVELVSYSGGSCLDSSLLRSWPAVQ